MTEVITINDVLNQWNQMGVSEYAFLYLILPYLIFGILFYIYVSLAFMKIGKRAELDHPGIAWIPGIGRIIIAFQTSKMHWWPWLLLIVILIPLININLIILTLLAIASITFLIYTIIWDWKMFQTINRPGWWALLLFIPVVNLIIIGLAAWSNK